MEFSKRIVIWEKGVIYTVNYKYLKFEIINLYIWEIKLVEFFLI